MGHCRKKSVSYTHLDVYKRQIILFNQGGGAEAGYSLFECYRLIPAALSAEIIDMGSYIGNLVLQYLFVALGAILSLIHI